MKGQARHFTWEQPTKKESFPGTNADGPDEDLTFLSPTSDFRCRDTMISL
jgi:hypothetical protein